MTRPRLLVVAADRIGSPTNTGITLANMVRGWPDHELAQVFTSPTESAQTRGAALFVSQDRLLPLRLYRRLREGGPARVGPASAGDGAALGRPPWQRAWADTVPFSTLRDLDEFVVGFGPDVVITPTGSIRIARLARRAARRARAMTVPMFMDDWLSTLYRHPGQLVPRALLLREVDAVVRRSRIGLAISPAMAGEYSERFGVPFHVFGNAVDEADFGRLPEAVDTRCRLLYVGGLHLGRAETLTAVARAVETVPGVRLTVVAPDAPASFRAAVAGLRHTRLADPVRPDEVMPLLAQGDVLVHVESFAPQDVAYTRLSLSTKIPQYLAAGRPVLGVGPSALASMSYLSDVGAGYVVDRASPDDIAAALRRLVDPDLRRALARRGLAHARSAHGAAERSSALERLLAGLLSGPKDPPAEPGGSPPRPTG